MFNVKDDIRIEIMEALLNNSILSEKAFSALAGLFDSLNGDNDDAWTSYKDRFSDTEATPT